jgi:hypothetical protein
MRSKSQSATLATPADHPFYERLNRLLSKRGFDAFAESACQGFYPAGRPIGAGSVLPRTSGWIFRRHRFRTWHRAANSVTRTHQATARVRVQPESGNEEAIGIRNASRTAGPPECRSDYFSLVVQRLQRGRFNKTASISASLGNVAENRYAASDYPIRGRTSVLRS